MGKNNKKNKFWNNKGLPPQSTLSGTSAKSFGESVPAQGNQPPSTGAAIPDELAAKDIVELVQIAAVEGTVAETSSTSEGVAAMPSGDPVVPAADVPTPSREQIVEAIQSLRRAKGTADERQREAESAKARHDAAVTELESQRTALKAKEDALKSAAANLASEERELETERIQLITQRAQAEQGFPELLAAWRKDEESAMQKRRDELARLSKEMEADRSALAQDQQEVRDAERKLGIKRSGLDAREELLKERIELERQEAADQAREAQDLERDADQLKIAQLEKSLKSEKDRADKLQDVLDDAGGLSIKDLAEKKRRLDDEVNKLKLALANNPTQEMVEALQRDADRAKSLEARVVTLESKLAQAQSELDRTLIPVKQQENYKITVENMKLKYEELKEANSLLQEEVRNKLDQSEGRRTFPEMSRMDDDPDLQRPARTSRSVTDLQIVVQNTRAFMANRDRPLYYDLKTIRCFLAGLAMSRLHILQGISGTGKTSLPIAFAEALGGGADKIAVQAGWRERQDLLGYYNGFDKKQYHETEFVKSLYRAQCPRWKDSVRLIVLDEMNLSYVEQFGADLLAELESPHPEGMRLALMNTVAGNPPALLLAGSEIRIPDNVWFIGTANRDETTKDFADKSYDRAHTMELPRHPKMSQIPSTRREAPLSADHLGELFAEAKRNHSEAARVGLEFIEQLAPRFRDDFGLGWGNRLERQIKDFIPIIVAAGGTIAEAVDHLISTKLLRKLEHRHNVRPAKLETLRRLLVESATKAPKLHSGASKIALPDCDAKLAAIISERRYDDEEVG